MAEKSEGLITSAEFARRMRWKTATVWKKLYNSRLKIKAGEKLTVKDFPLPDRIDKDGHPLWSPSKWERYARNYVPRPGYPWPIFPEDEARQQETK